MPSVRVDRDRCKGCELCTFYCPMKILGMSQEINLKGYFFAEVRDPGRCIGCMLCAITCPDLAIAVHGNSVQYQTFDYFGPSGSGQRAGGSSTAAARAERSDPQNRSAGR